MDQNSSGRSFRLRVWHIGLLLVIFFICMFAVFVLSGRSRLEREIAAIRAAGYPTNFEELDKYYSIGEGVPNAADVYAKAFDAYQDPFDVYMGFDPYQKSTELADHLPCRGSKFMADRRGPLDPNSVKAIISNLQANKETLEFLDKAAAIEHCRYDMEFSPRGMPHIPDLTRMRGCAELLAEQTMLLAHQGDANAAVENIARQLALVESLKKEPILGSQLVRMGCTAMNCSSVEYILNRTTLTDEQLTGLQQRLSQVYQDNPMVMGLIGERCFTTWLFDNPQYWGLPATTNGLLRITGVAERNVMMSLEMLGQYIDAMKLPGQQRLTQCRKISAEVDELSLFYPLTKMRLDNSWDWIAQIDLRTTAQIDCAIVALGIERYRLAKGSLPKVLDDLVPRYIDKVPIDPFDGKPVRYKLTEPGYIVYSVGADGTDEGGLEKDKVAKRGDPYDWPIIVEH